MIQELKETPGYVANPLDQQVQRRNGGPVQDSVNSGDVSPPTVSGSVAPQVSSVIPGEVVQPQAQTLTPDSADTSALADGISNALGGILEAVAPDNPDPNAPAPGLEPPANAQGGTAQPRTGLLATIAPEAYNSAQGTMSVASVQDTPDVYKPNERGYTSVLPAILGQEKPPERQAPVNPQTVSQVVESYRANPAAFTLGQGELQDLSSNVGTNWNFGTMQAPNALVVHHTAGGGNRDGVIQTFKERNYPAHFIIERDGTIVQVLGTNQKGQHTRPAQDGSGISNSNSWGVEIIAKDDSDLTPTQVTAAAKLAKHLEQFGLDRKRIVGHGAINSHKQATEGQTVTQALAQLGG